MPFRDPTARGNRSEGADSKQGGLDRVYDERHRLAAVARPGKLDERTNCGFPVRDLRPQAAVIQFVVQCRQWHQAAGGPAGKLGQAPVHTAGVRPGQIRVEKGKGVHDQAIDRTWGVGVFVWTVHCQEVDVLDHRDPTLSSTMVDYNSASSG